MTLTLKPCPFCGGKAEVRHVRPYYNYKKGIYLGYFVICNQCLTSSDNYSTADEAAKHWNTRPKID